MENEIKDTKSEEENSAELTPTAAETTDPSADSAGQTEPADPQKPKKAKKKKKKSGWFYKVTIVLLIAIMAFSAYKIITILYEYHVGTSEYEQVQEIAGTQSADKAKTYSGKVNFAALQKKYKNVKACLKEGVLTLNGISISSSNSDIITADGDLTIHEIGRNVICKYVPNGHTNIKVNGSLIVEGDPGSVLLVDVRLYGNDDTPSADAIDCSGDFTLKSGGLYAAAILGDAIKAANVNVTGGELTAEFCSSGYSAIRAERDGTLGNVNISGGTVIAAEPWKN